MGRVISLSGWKGGVMPCPLWWIPKCTEFGHLYFLQSSRCIYFFYDIPPVYIDKATTDNWKVHQETHFDLSLKWMLHFSCVNESGVSWIARSGHIIAHLAVAPSEPAIVLAVVPFLCSQADLVLEPETTQACGLQRGRLHTKGGGSESCFLRGLKLVHLWKSTYNYCASKMLCHMVNQGDPYGGLG